MKYFFLKKRNGKKKYVFSGDGKCEDTDFDSEPTSLDKTSADVSCGQSSDADKGSKTF